MRIGIDLGGTKIEAIALDSDGQILGCHRTSTPRGDYQATLSTISGLITRLEAETGRRGTVGVGIPGIVSPRTGLVTNSNATWLINHPFAQDLQTSLGRSVRVANDANCFTLSEAVDGAGSDAQVVFGVTLGTGCGGAIVIDRKPYLGMNAMAGEWGHMPLPWPKEDERPGPLCHCGNYGCLETWVSGPGLAADHQRTTGMALDPKQIAVKAEAGDRVCLASLERLTDRLSRGLSLVLTLLDPEVVILGGGLCTIEYFYRTLPSLIEQRLFTNDIVTPIRQAYYGESSGVRGAAFLYLSE